MNHSVQHIGAKNNKTKYELTEEEKETSPGTLAVILLVILIVWLGFKWFSADMDGVNALFSGLAFATLIFTVFLQRRELALQRAELRDTKEELKRSATAQEASEEALRAQAKATEQSIKLATVNSLLGFYRQEISKIRHTSGGDEDDEIEHPHFQMYLAREETLIRILDATYEQMLKRNAIEHLMSSGLT